MLMHSEVVDMFSLRNATYHRDEISCSCPYTQNHKRGDANPSFGINVRKQVFICRSCGESGNLVKLAMDILGLDRFSAMRAVYRDLSQEEALALMHGSERVGRSEPISPIEADISRWCSGPRDYWYSRGFNDETIGKWRLGYDTYENRATVPVYWKGSLVGWTKRAGVDGMSPKWTHYPGMPKSRMLFGMDAVDTDSAILVEAPLSAIMLDQYGIKGAVASFGASLSDDQAVLLRSHFNNVLIFYDPDQAGVSGTRKAIDKLEKFMNVYIVQPTRDDPAAMSREECLEAINVRPVISSWAWKPWI